MSRFEERLAIFCAVILLIVGLIFACKALGAPLVIDCAGTWSFSGSTVSCAGTTPVPPDPQPPTGFANCTNQGYRVLDGGAIPWATGGSFYSSQVGTFDSTAAWVFTITPPLGTGATTTPGHIAVAEYGSLAAVRQITVSTKPCDWGYPGNGISPIYAGSGTSAWIPYFGVGSSYPYYLTPGITYYVSSRNYSLQTNQPGCVGTNCTAIMNVSAAQ